MRNIAQLLVVWFGVLMVLVVVVLGTALLTTDFYTERLSGPKRTIFIVILFLYAVYRSFRTYTIFKSRKNDED